METIQGSVFGFRHPGRSGRNDAESRLGEQELRVKDGPYEGCQLAVCTEVLVYETPR